MLVEKFLRWFETAPAIRRSDAVTALVRAYFVAELDAEEREAMEAAMTIMLDDPSPDVRRALATALALHEDAPRHLVLTLVEDHPIIAEPLLQRWPGLIDAELVDLVAGGAPRVQRAIAGRPRLSAAVSAAIAEVGSLTALIALIENAGAQITPASFARMAARHGDEPMLREALLVRSDLPIAVRQELIVQLGDALGRLALVRSCLSADRARSLTREACDKATVTIAATAGIAQMPALVEHLRRSGQLTTALLIRFACAGNIVLLENAISVLSGVPLRRVYALVADGRESSLRALFARARLPERSYPAFLAALEVWREADEDEATPADAPHVARRISERILARYERLGWTGADDLLPMLRRLAAEAARDAARAYRRKAA